ncbi:MAG: acetolactate synthase [Dehalococcoidia bacterium]|nr:acetolactate synthase [Dehalococcoidia bacterium]
MTEELSGNDLVARTLRDQGIEAVFTVVGGPVIEAVAACGAAGVRPIGARHEQAAAMMATSFGYVGNSVGTALLASGPAVTNALTAVHVAWDNSLPLVVLGGSSSQRQRGRMPFQEADQVTLMRPITKWSIQVDSAERIPEIIGMAYRKAMAGRPGPVYVDLPADVLSARVEKERVRPAPAGPPPQPPQGDPAAIERAAELLLRAERPLALVGKGVRWSESHEELRELLEVLGVPFLPSPMGRGFIPDDHPLCVSAARGHAMRNADVVIVIGARLNWIFGGGQAFAPEAKIIQIDIEPEEIGLWRDAEVGIVADIGSALGQLLSAIEGRAEGMAALRQESAWRHELREQVAKNEAAVEPLLNSDATPLNHHRLMREIRDLMPRDAIVTVDGQITFATARQIVPSFTPASRLNSGSNGCMGVGVPFAVGAALARPGTPVISINGDSAFGFNGMEVETAVRLGLPIVFVVDNNQGIMGSVLERQMFPGEHPDAVAMYTPGARYDKLMEAFGGHGEHVERPEEIRPALERAFAAGRAALVDVAVDPAAIWPIPTAGRSGSRLMGY